MSDFINAFRNMINDEGGYKLHKVKGDTGGLTFAGITQKHHPDWLGWDYINEDPAILQTAVSDFYKEKYWNRIQADKYKSSYVKDIIFNFSVNAGCRSAIKLVQSVLRVSQDGIIGPVTIKKLNEMDPEIFCSLYTIEKISRYATICNRNSVQKKFLLGWINRTLKSFKQGKK